jgi:hypothetical protein
MTIREKKGRRRIKRSSRRIIGLSPTTIERKNGHTRHPDSVVII